MELEKELYEKYPSHSQTKFRFHVLSLPHTVTTKEYCACAYTMKVLKFCNMMKKRGHYIIHYGHEDSVVNCDERVTLMTNEDLKKTYGDYDWRKDFFKHGNDDCHKIFNKRGVVEVLKRIQRKDFVLPFWGIGHHNIIEAAKKTGKVLVVEPGIGYNNPLCDYRIYESYAVLHHTMGLQNSKNPSWYHCVIPNYFELEDFEYSDKKSDYYLYLGRIAYCKGVQIAVQVTEKMGAKLIIAGQGDFCREMGYKKIPDHVECVGYANVEKRKELMKNAKGLFLLSDYVEPFGGTAVEAMISGTPVITTDWGVFAETVIHGVTGYRCRTFEQICWAAKNITNIKSEECRKWAIQNYSCAKVSTMYEEFFSQLYNLWDNGWYEENENRTNLDWLYKEFPVPEVALYTINMTNIKSLISQVQILKENSDYRCGDIVYHRGPRWEHSKNQILNNPKYENTIFKNFLKNNNGNDLDLKFLLKCTEEYCSDNNLPIPDQDELVIHLRMGDVVEHQWFLNKNYINLIKNIKKNNTISKITIVTSFAYQAWSEEQEILWKKKSNGQAQPFSWNYTHKKQEKNEKCFFKLLFNLQDQFNLPINIYSNKIIDVDLCYCVFSKHFIKDQGGFSDLMEKLNQLMRQKN